MGQKTSTGKTQMTIPVANMREIVAAAVVVALVSLMAAMFPLTLAETACAPAAHLAPSIEIPPTSDALSQGRPVSEQAGELAAFYRHNF